jgi:superfamily II DNA helicase RecQ
MRQKKQEIKRRALLSERNDLFKSLQELRREVANRLGCSNKIYMICQNRTLEEMTLMMSKNKAEMLEIYGIKEK